MAATLNPLPSPIYSSFLLLLKPTQAKIKPRRGKKKEKINPKIAITLLFFCLCSSFTNTPQCGQT